MKSPRFESPASCHSRASIVAAISVSSWVFFAACGPRLPAEEVVRLGAGGYVVRPLGKSPPVLSREFLGHPPTQQWFSHLVFAGKKSERQYAHPLSLRPSAGGLGIHAPGRAIHATKDAIFASMPEKPDLTLRGAGESDFEEVALEAASDWFIQCAFTTARRGIHASWGHGSPFVYATSDAPGGAQIVCPAGFEVVQGAIETPSLAIRTGGAVYALFGPAGCKWTARGKDLALDGARYLSLALLPDAEAKTFEFFRKFAHAHVTDTRVEWSFEPERGSSRTTYRFTTTPREGTETGTITALYPHQWKHAVEGTAFTEWSYPSVRGLMKVVSGAEFVTSMPIQGVLPGLPPEGLAEGDRALVAKALREEPALRKGAPLPFRDTYAEGKLLGRLTSLAGVAEAAGDEETRDACVGELKRRLEAWFSATPGKASPVFAYDPTWGVLIGLPASFGTSWPFNDLHFHYGYFIRAAAEIARHDPVWSAREYWGAMVDLLVRDIANPKRDARFPRLRCFDRYAGHSWASGDAAFADGNNQESSSEAMNAWYSLILWGTATDNAAIRDLGLYLYTTEMRAVEEYWFDVEGTNFPRDFPHEAVGMCWGGKGAWGTWFSGDPDCIQGINWLPFTPGSLYLARHEDYVERAFRALAAERKSGSDFHRGWGDLALMFLAGRDPAEARRLLGDRAAIRIEDGNSRPFFLHWIGTFERHGRIDPTVSADHPFHAVFRKGGRRTYLAANPSRRPLTVVFTDGTRLEVGPRAWGSVER